jgi:O-antigen/teichoic acid export membrane protein
MIHRLIPGAGIRREAAFKLASELLGRAASFALVLVAARELGESAFGLYNYGLAFGFVVAQLADLGLQVLVSREIAIRGQEARDDVILALRLKLFLSFVVLGLLAVGSRGPNQVILLLLGAVPLAQTYLEFAAYVFRGQRQLLVEARLLAGARLLTATMGVGVLWLGGGVLSLAVVSLIAVIVLGGWSLLLLQRGGWLSMARNRPGDTVKRTNVDTYRRLLGQTLPLGAAVFLSITYTRLAILLLQQLDGTVAVAHYSAAYRLVEPTQILPASLLAAAFPAYARAWRHEPDVARRLSLRVTLLLLVAGAMVGAILWFGAPWLVPLLYGATYEPAVSILRILSFSVLPAFVNYSLTHYLIAQGMQARFSFLTGLMLLAHVLFSWALIPRLGARGPAVSVVLAELILLASCLVALSIDPSAIAAPEEDSAGGDDSQ